MGAVRILITRNAPDKQEVLLPEENFELISHEFIKIRPVRSIESSAIAAYSEQADLTALLFTSKNAVQCTHDLLPQLRPANNIFCIGGGTSEKAREYYGADHIAAVADNAASLARELIARPGFRQAVFFCGDKRREDLPEILAAHGINLQEVHVYFTELTPAIIAGHFDGVIFFSPSAVESFFSMNTIDAGTVCFAIGSTTASALTAITKNRVVVSAAINEKILLETVRDYFNKDRHRH